MENQVKSEQLKAYTMAAIESCALSLLSLHPEVLGMYLEDLHTKLQKEIKEPQTVLDELILLSSLQIAGYYDDCGCKIKNLIIECVKKYPNWKGMARLAIERLFINWGETREKEMQQALQTILLIKP